MPRSLRSLGMTLAVLAATPLEAQTRHEFRELHMGVEVRMVLFARDGSTARHAARAAFDRIAALEDIMSDYRPESELRRLERRPGEWVKVSDELVQVLARAVAVAEATDGAFDPTIGPLVALWRESRQRRRLPATRGLDSARALVGWRHIALDTTGRRVRLALPGMRLDLGGIAKGEILQRAADQLRARGMESSLVGAGGDIVVGDPPPGRRGWTIDVQDSAVVLSNAAISTSGPSVQFVEIDGTRYSHIVDPQTGLGLTSTRHATVIAAHAGLADALATALTVLDEADADRVLSRFPGARGWIGGRSRGRLEAATGLRP